MRAALETHLGSRQVARIVYGSIIGLALIVGLGDHPPTAGVMTAWLILTAVAVALAELYSEVVGVETSERHRVTAFAVAKWSGLGLIGFYGYWAARFSGAPVARALVQATMAAVGGALIMFKALLH